jgi:hypothetical protein
MTKPIIAKPWRRSALLCVFLAAITQTAAAQGVAGSFEQLQVLVKPGDTVTVTDAAGKQTNGKIAELTGSTLALLAGDTRLELRERDVVTIKQLYTDSLADGAIWGAVGGGVYLGIVAVMFSGDADEWSASDVARSLGICVGIGTGIGVGIDALIRRKHVIYQRPPTSGVQIGITPLLTSQRKGVQVTLRF